MDKISQLGYSALSPYRNNPYLDINTPEGYIDMSNTDIPLYGVDETGYSKMLMPYSGMHKFKGKKVREYRMQTGGQIVTIKDSMNLKSGNYPKDKVENIIKASKAIGVNPYDAVALALQENSFGTFKNTTTQETRSRRNRQPLGSVGNVGLTDSDYNQINSLSSKGLDYESLVLAKALQKKMAYAQSLGFTDPAMQLQAYNGYGHITKDTFGGADKAYGVPIGNGIDMRKNPLYGKRLLQLANDLKSDKSISSLFLREGGYMQLGGPNPYLNNNRGDMRSYFAPQLPPSQQKATFVQQQAQAEQAQAQEKLIKKGFGTDAAKYEASKIPSKRNTAAQQAIQQYDNEAYRVKMHPDYNPQIPVDQQMNLNDDNSMRTMILRGRNYFMNDKGANPIIRFIDKNMVAPASSLANMTLDANNQYFKPGLKQGLFNFGKDAITLGSAFLPESTPLGEHVASHAVRQLGTDAVDVLGNTDDFLSKLGMRKSLSLGDITPTFAEMLAEKYQKGGLTPEKAHEMLKDGTAHGHPLTDKQKRYFGMLYGNSLKKSQYGGNPFANELFSYLMEDDEPQQQAVVKTSSPTVEEADQSSRKEDPNVDNDLAMEIASGDYTALASRKGNPYNDKSSFATAKMGVNPFVLKTQHDILGMGATDLGIWGDEAHQRRKSDHNTGDAEDFGFSSLDMANSIVNKLQSEANNRNVKYIIYNNRIWNPSISNDWRPYNGADPHTNHIHVSYNR